MSGHTPGPWELQENGSCYNLRCADRVDHFAILVGMVHNNPGEFQANAERIVRCVNAFDDLLAACKAFQDKTLLMDLWSNDDLKPILRRMKAAIAKAEGDE